MKPIVTIISALIIMAMIAMIIAPEKNGQGGGSKAITLIQSFFSTLANFVSVVVSPIASKTGA